MHEISIMQSTLEMAVQTAMDAKATGICRIRLRVGALSGVVPDALRFAFETLREGTLAENAELDIDEVAVRCWCAQCHSEFAATDWLEECPTCHQLSSELRAGLELELASIETT